MSETQQSSIRTQRFDFINTYLIEQIRSRYAFYDRPKSGLSNIIIDNFVPKWFYKSSMFQDAEVGSDIMQSIPASSYALNPWIAEFFGVKHIPIEMQCQILGYKLKTLKKLIQIVKAKEYVVSFVGYGGTGVNTIYYLTKLLELTGNINIFKHINIFENDRIEISNLFRYPKSPFTPMHTSNSTRKYNLFSKTERRIIAKTGMVHGSRLSVEHYTQVLYSDYIRSLDTINPYCKTSTQKCIENKWISEKSSTKVKDKHILYGAPDIQTRFELSELGNFISATHSGNGCTLHLNPTQNTHLQLETYGLISLTQFSMNQLKLAISFLEVLAQDIDFQEKDKVLIDYEFTGQAEGTVDRTFNFQLEHNGLIQTEEQANNN